MALRDASGRFVAGGGIAMTASGAPVALSFQLDVRQMNQLKKVAEQYRGAPLAARMERGALEAARLLVRPVRAETPVGPTGNLRRSIAARSVRSQQNGLSTRMLTGSGVRAVMAGMGSSLSAAGSGGIASAFVGPSSRIAPHRHLVIRGHRIVTPGGRDLGRRTTANPFVDHAAQPRQAEAVRVVMAAIWGTSA